MYASGSGAEAEAGVRKPRTLVAYNRANAAESVAITTPPVTSAINRLTSQARPGG